MEAYYRNYFRATYNLTLCKILGIYFNQLVEQLYRKYPSSEGLELYNGLAWNSEIFQGPPLPSR